MDSGSKTRQVHTIAVQYSEHYASFLAITNGNGNQAISYIETLLYFPN